MSAFIPKPQFPNVPNVAGVPPVQRAPSAAVQEENAILAVADAAIVLQMFGPPQWGVFDSLGLTPVLVGDCVARVGYSREARVADYPIEGGGFASYDKVQTPYDAKVTISVGSSGALGIGIGGSLSREAFLDALESYVSGPNALALVTVVTPEKTYENASIVRFNYDRSAKAGAGMLNVDIWLREIRLTATSAFTNTANPSSADPVNGGQVQPQAPSAQVVSAASQGAN